MFGAVVTYISHGLIVWKNLAQATGESLAPVDELSGKLSLHEIVTPFSA